MAIERGLVAADELDAIEIVAVGRERGVMRFSGIRTGRRLRLTGEALPGEDKIKVWIVACVGVNYLDVAILNGHLQVNEGGFDGNEAGLTPIDGGEVVNEALLDIAKGEERSAEAVEVSEPIGFVFDGEDDVLVGGEAVFYSVRAGLGFAFGGDGTFGFGSVDAGLFGTAELGGVEGVHGLPFNLDDKDTPGMLSMNSVIPVR